MLNLAYFLITSVGILSAIIILSSLNPISRLAFQILVFLMAAFQFLVLDYYFLGLTYIIVYVGAIAILFLFVIMLLQTDTNPISKGWSVNSMMFILYLVIAVAVAMGLTIDQDTISLPGISQAYELFEVFGPAWAMDLVTLTDIQSQGNVLYLGYPVVIALLGLVLWVVLIGILRISKNT